MNTPFFGRLSVHLDRADHKPPHLFSKNHTRGRMWLKSMALVPLMAAACAAGGWLAVQVFSAAVCGAVLAETLGAWLFQRKPAYHDGEVFFIGIFCAFLFPLTLSIWVFFAAAFIAVLMGRELFGGYGQAIVFPPAVGLLVLFLGLPQLIQAFDFKEARSLAAFLPLKDSTLNPLNFLFYSSGAALEDVSLLALFLGAAVLLGRGLVRWELPLLGVIGNSTMRLWLEKSDTAFLFSGGFWLALFWGLAQTSAMPLTPGGRRIYALLTGVLAAVCPLKDESLRVLAALCAVSLISPWLDARFAWGRFGQKQEP